MATLVWGSLQLKKDLNKDLYSSWSFWGEQTGNVGLFLGFVCYLFYYGSINLNQSQVFQFKSSSVRSDLLAYKLLYNRPNAPHRSVTSQLIRLIYMYVTYLYINYLSPLFSSQISTILWCASLAHCDGLI